MLPKSCLNPAKCCLKSCLALLNTAQAEIDKQKPSSDSEKQPFQEHHLRYVQFFYINWKYLRGIVRISSCLRSGNFTSRQKFWPRFFVCSESGQNGTNSNYSQPQLNFSFSIMKGLWIEKLNQVKLFERYCQSMLQDLMKLNFMTRKMESYLTDQA